MLFSGKKIFSCVWLHFKKCFEKYFLMFGCVLENTIKNTFSTCCTHFLLVAHIFSAVKRIYNIIHSSKHKQNPEKNHQIRTLRAIAIGAKARSRRFRRSKLQTISASSALDDLYSLFFLSPSLSFSRSLSLLRVTRKWFEGKMKV